VLFVDSWREERREEKKEMPRSSSVGLERERRAREEKNQLAMASQLPSPLPPRERVADPPKAQSKRASSRSREAKVSSSPGPEPERLAREKKTESSSKRPSSRARESTSGSSSKRSSSLARESETSSARKSVKKPEDRTSPGEEDEDGGVEFMPPLRPKEDEGRRRKVVDRPSIDLSTRDPPPLTPISREIVRKEESCKRTLWLVGTLATGCIVIFTVFYGLNYALSDSPEEAALSRAIKAMKLCRGLLDCGGGTPSNNLESDTPTNCMFTSEDFEVRGITLSLRSLQAGLQRRLGDVLVREKESFGVATGQGTFPSTSCAIWWSTSSFVWWILRKGYANPLRALLSLAIGLVTLSLYRAWRARQAFFNESQDIKDYKSVCDVILFYWDGHSFPNVTLEQLRDKALEVLDLNPVEQSRMKSFWPRVESLFLNDKRFRVQYQYNANSGSYSRAISCCLTAQAAMVEQTNTIRARSNH